jgi:hypothetical protein
MNKRRAFLAFLLPVLSAHVQGQSQQSKNMPAGSCENSPLFKELLTPAGSALLSAYGFSFKQVLFCRRIEVPWAAGASLLHFEKAGAQTDDNTSFSVMKVPGIVQIWIIPTGSGMLEAPHVDGDPHNLAAFNALLRYLPKRKPSETDWIAVGRLYMALVGHSKVISLCSAEGQTSPCSVGGDSVVAFSDRTPQAKENYVKWTLTFEAADRLNPVRLADVSREVVSPGESDLAPKLNIPIPPIPQRMRNGWGTLSFLA